MAKKEKRKLPLIEYKIRDFRDYQDITDQTFIRKMVYDNLIDSIQYSIRNNKKDAELLQLANTDNIICLDKKDWKEPLTTAMSFYIENGENYERCIEIKQILNKI